MHEVTSLREIWFSHCGLMFMVGFAVVFVFLLTAVCAAALRRRRCRKTRFIGRSIDRSGTHTVKFNRPRIHHGDSVKDALHLWVADMDFPCCEQILHAIQLRAQHPSFGYTMLPEVIWHSVGKWLVKRQGWPVLPDTSSFVFSPSVTTSWCNIVRCLTNLGDAVLVFTPLYWPLQEGVLNSSRKLVEIPMRIEGGQYELCSASTLASAIEEKGVRMLCLCNPHNPSGRVWSREELQLIATVCAQQSVLVVSDEIWADWCFDGPGRFVSFSSIASKTGCAHIILNSPAKTFSIAGLSASWIYIPDQGMREKYFSYASAAFLTATSAFATTALISAYDCGDEWIDGAIDYVAQNLRVFANYLRDNAPSLAVIRPGATYLVWIDCSCIKLRGVALHKFLIQQGLYLNKGAEFDMSGASDAFVRINIACSREIVLEAAKRLSQAVKRVAMVQTP